MTAGYATGYCRVIIMIPQDLQVVYDDQCSRLFYKYVINGSDAAGHSINIYCLSRAVRDPVNVYIAPFRLAAI